VIDHPFIIDKILNNGYERLTLWSRETITNERECIEYEATGSWQRHSCVKEVFIAGRKMHDNGAVRQRPPFYVVAHNGEGVDALA